MEVVVLKRITNRGLGAELPAAGGYRGLRAKPPAAARFLVIFGKISYFNAIRMCSEPFERIRFLTFESQLKKLNGLIFLLLTI